MPLYQVELSDGRKYKVEADGQPSEEDIYAFLGSGAAEAPAEEKGYLSQLGTSLGIGLDQALIGTRSTWNALTGDNADLSQNLAAFGRTQQEVAANQTPADIKLNEALAVADKKWEQGDYLDSLTDIGGAVIDEPGAAFKTAVQSAPNAIVGLGGQLAGRALGAAAGGVAGSPTGPGAIIPAVGGYVAGGVLANSIMEAGPAIFDALNERTGGRAAQMSDAEIKALLDSDPTIMTDGLLKGATRGSVIGLIESLGLYGAGRVASVPARAASKSALSALAKEGVDVGSREALEAALADPAKKAIFDAAEKAALSEFSTLGTAARLGAGAAIETGAAGAGEAGAQLVTEGEVKPSEVAMEMVGEVGLSPVAAAAAKSLETAANVVAPAAPVQPEADPLGEVEPDMPDMTGEQRTAEEGVLNEIRRQAEAAAAAAPNPVVDAATAATETAEATASVAPETAATLASIAEQTAVETLAAQTASADKRKAEWAASEAEAEEIQQEVLRRLPPMPASGATPEVKRQWLDQWEVVWDAVEKEKDTLKQPNEGLDTRGTEEGLGTDSGGSLQPTGPVEVAASAQTIAAQQARLNELTLPPEVRDTSGERVGATLPESDSQVSAGERATDPLDQGPTLQPEPTSPVGQPSTVANEPPLAKESTLDLIKRLRATGLNREQIMEHPEYLAAKDKEKQDSVSKGKVQRDWFEGFLSGNTPTTKGKLQKALEARMRFADVPYEDSLRGHIERLLDGGYAVTFDSRGNRVFVKNDMSGYGVTKLGKVGMDYASFITSKKADALKQPLPDETSLRTADQPGAVDPSTGLQAGPNPATQPAAVPDTVPSFSSYLRTVTPADKWTDSDYTAAQAFASGDDAALQGLSKVKRNAVVRELLSFDKEARAKQAVAEAEERRKFAQRNRERPDDAATLEDALNKIGYEPLPDDVESASIGGRDRRYIDVAYMAAVDAGDMASAQRMVDQAAREAGYDQKVYHSTDANFNAFRRGSHFGTERAAKDIFSLVKKGRDHRVLPVFLKAKNPLRLTDGEANDIAILLRAIKDGKYPQLKGESGRAVSSEDIAAEFGYDAIVYKNGVEDKGSDSWAIIDPSQIKSADPVVRDDAGQIIPLSQRFNPQSDDIRYSLSDEDAPSTPLSVEEAQELLGLTNYDNIVFGNYAPLSNGITLKGFVRQGSNKIHINLGAVTTENIRDVFNEEATHLVWDDPAVAKDWARLKQLVPQDQLDALRKEMEERGYVESKWDEEAFNDVARKLGYEWLQQPAWKRLWLSLKAAVKRIFGLTDDTEINRVSARILSYAIANQQSMMAEAGASGESRGGSPFRTSKDSPRDAEYLRAVTAGDIATAQRIIDEAARGVRSNIDVQKLKAGKYSVTRDDGKVFTIFHNPASDKWVIEDAETFRTTSSKTFDGAKDDIIFGWSEVTQRKLDPLVRNDVGEVIPPSERFNSEDPDIRYSLGSNVFTDLANDTPGSFDAYDRAKRATLGDPPSPTGTSFTPPRFTGPDHFEAFFNDAYDRGDYTQFLEGFKASDPAMYRPVLKKLLRAAKLGDTDAADRAEWFRHVISGTIPPNAKEAPATPPPAKPGAPAPPPPATPPAPPPPPPKPRVSSKPRVTLNTAAMVWVAKKLGESPVVNRLLRRSRGRYNPNSPQGRRVQMHEQLFKDPVQAAKTLAHEIGHFLDYLPTHIFRGNLSKRIAPLGDYKKVFGPLWDWSGLTNSKNPAAALNKVLKAEAIELSKEWRGDFDAKDTYRNSASELYADFVSAFLNDPSWTAQKAPNLTLGFLEALDNKPEVAAAYFNLVNIVKGGRLYKVMAGERKAAQEKTLADLQTQKAAIVKKRSSFKRAFGQLYTAAVGKHTLTAAKDGGWWKNRKKRMENFGGDKDYVTQAEQAEQYSQRAASKVRDSILNRVVISLAKAGIAPEFLDRYLLNQRIIKERTATGKYLEENPAEARAFLKWLVDTGTLGKDLIDQIDNAADEDLYNLGAKIIRQLHESDSFDDVYNAAQRVGAPPLAERGLFAFDVSGFMANPDGRTPQSAAEDNADIRDELGDTLFDDLEGIATNYYDIIREVAIEANKVGLFKPEVWSERIEPNLDNYVPFMVLDYFTGHVDAGMKSRSGTVKHTLISQMAGEDKAVAMIARIQRQKQTEVLKKFFETEGVTHGFAKEMTIINDPKMDRAKADKMEREQGVGMVGFWDNGTYKWLRFEDPSVVDAIKRFDPDDLNALFTTLRRNSNGWRLVMTVLSPSFIIRNALRGIRTSWTRLGFKNAKAAVSMILKGIPYAAKYGRFKLKSAYRGQIAQWLRENNVSEIYGAALNVQYAYYLAEGAQPSPALQELLDKGVLPPRFDFNTLGMTQDEVRAAVMAGYISSSALAATSKTKKNWLDKTVLPTFKGAWDFMSFVAAIQEAAPKIAAYQTLAARADVTPEMREAVARGEGIPNPGVSGNMNKWLELIFMFWRVAMQGHRATLNSAMNPKTRGGFLLRAITTELAPKVLYGLAAAGALDTILKSMMGGDDDDEQVDMEEAYERLSPYKIYKDDAIPLFWLKPDGGIEWMFGHKSIPETWTPIAVRIPASEEGRWASPASMYLVAQLFADDLAPVDNQQFAGEFVKNFVPGLNPTFEYLGQYKAALFDAEVPRDSYRNRPIMPEDKWIDGGLFGRMMGITKNLAAQSGVPLLAQGSYQNPNMSMELRALLSMPVIKTLFASDNFYGVLEEQRRRYDEKLAGAAARNMRGGETRNMVRRYESLETKGKDNRSDLEEDEFQTLRRWYNSDYNGSGRKRGLMDDLREAAKAKYADAPEVELKVLQGQAKDSAAALEESAKALREELREMRKEGAQ